MESQSPSSTQTSKRVGLVLTGLFTLAVIALLFTGIPTTQADAATLFLPVVQTDATQAAVPSVVATIPLPEAECPNDIVFNRASGYIYVTNEESDNISILKGTQFLGSSATGNWPIWLASHPTTTRVYGTHVLGTITAFDNGAVTTQIQGYHEPYNMVINTTNGLFYVSDLHSRITILQDDAIVTHLPLVDTSTDKPIEWNLAGDFDPVTGLTYFASWENGRLSILDGTQMVDQFSYGGQGAKDMVIDPFRRRMVLANFRAGEDDGPTQNATVVNLDTHQVVSIDTSEQSRHVALEPTSGFAYVTDPKDDTVTVLNGTAVHAIAPTGKTPWGVLANPQTGQVFVTNSGENSLTVLKRGEVIDTIELPDGYQPYALTLDEATNTLYVLHRSSRFRYDDYGRPKLVCEQPYVTVLR